MSATSDTSKITPNTMRIKKALPRDRYKEPAQPANHLDDASTDSDDRPINLKTKALPAGNLETPCPSSRVSGTDAASGTATLDSPVRVLTTSAQTQVHGTINGPGFEQYAVPVIGCAPGQMDQYQGINAMPYYCGSSFEELRVQDYSETGKFKDSFDDRKAWRDPLFTSLDDSVDGTDENSTKGDEDDEECPYIQDLKLCKRCEKLWYPDGNIVFHAADTIYRIHHSILSIHSRVFKDIFEKPFSDESHDTEVESFENCLVVRLLDSPKEIESLLMTIYYPFHFQESSHSYTFLDAALRVSTKYNFDTLRVNVLSKLTSSFPSTLEAFDELSRYPDRLRDSQKKALSVINLARYTSCFEFLPSAFYLCSRLSAQTILRGKGKNDMICAEDAATCIIGREELIKTWNKRTHEFLYEKPSISVFRRASCSECPKHTNEKLLEYLQAKDGAELFGLDQFDTWDVIGLCSKCAIPLQTKHQESRQQLWEQLPKVFGLGSWDELRTKQALREA